MKWLGLKYRAPFLGRCLLDRAHSLLSEVQLRSERVFRFSCYLLGFHMLSCVVGETAVIYLALYHAQGKYFFLIS